jgi:phosphoserine phosphatase
MANPVIQPLSWYLSDHLSGHMFNADKTGLEALASEDSGTIICYQEGQYLSQIAAYFPLRVRIIFELEVQLEIKNWLLGLTGPWAVAALTRQNSLQGIEIACKDNLAQVLKQFPVIDGAEVFAINEPLPQLSLPGLLVMDMDSTAIKIECIDELAKMAGVGEEVAAVTELAMQGELDFEQSLRLRVSKLKGANANIINKLCQQLPLMPGLEAMLAELKAYHWHLVLASGGFTHFVEHLQQQLSLDGAFANQLVIENGRLTGDVTGTVVDAEFKAKVLDTCGDKWHIPHAQRVAIGDGANDIPMVKRASFGIAFHSKPKLALAADVAINTLDLRALSFLLQG